MPSVFVTGNSGRVTVGGLLNYVVGLTKWKMTKKTKAVPLLHFESEVDADGNIYEDALVGTSEADITGEGWIDTNSLTATDSGSPGLRNGLVVSMSLILVKGTPWGFSAVQVLLTQVEIASAIDSDKPSPFTFSGKVKGTPGSTGVVTG